MLKVLYEDNHLIAVHKPAGMLVQGDASGDWCLMDEVKDYLKKKYEKKGRVFLGLLHRLDRPVEGVVLFAKTSKGASRLSEQIRNRETEKIYHALVCGMPEKKSGRLVHKLEKDTDRRRARESKTGDYAELFYDVEKMGRKYSLVRIRLVTGKFHQIRTQFSSIGHPVAGDVKYGAPEAFSWGIALAATSLSFETATTHEPVTVSVPIPEEWKNLLKM